LSTLFKNISIIFGYIKRLVMKTIYRPNSKPVTPEHSPPAKAKITTMEDRAKRFYRVAVGVL
jgi:hypothetical protein